MDSLIQLLTVCALLANTFVVWRVIETCRTLDREKSHDTSPDKVAEADAKPTPQQGNVGIDNSVVDPETVKLGLDESGADIPTQQTPKEKPLWNDIEKLKTLIDQSDEDDYSDEDSLAGLGPLDKQRVISDRILELEAKRDGRLN